jgi:hypothetical protein
MLEDFLKIMWQVFCLALCSFAQTCSLFSQASTVYLRLCYHLPFLLTSFPPSLSFPKEALVYSDREGADYFKGVPWKNNPNMDARKVSMGQSF